MAKNQTNPAAGDSFTSLFGPSAPGVSKIDPVSIPGFGPTEQSEFDPQQYCVRYAKIDLDDVTSRADLEILETRALRNEGIYILTKDKFTFADKYYMIVSYMELLQNANARR
jgi:D-hexose-6-phosphate mutarotase